MSFNINTGDDIAVVNQTRSPTTYPKNPKKTSLSIRWPVWIFIVIRQTVLIMAPIIATHQETKQPSNQLHAAFGPHRRQSHSHQFQYVSSRWLVVNLTNLQTQNTIMSLEGYVSKEWVCIQVHIKNIPTTLATHPSTVDGSRISDLTNMNHDLAILLKVIVVIECNS